MMRCALHRTRTGLLLKPNLSLNPALIRAPRECIEYVIVHELCHLREHNHSRRYYRILAAQMPNWQPLKAKLDGLAELILSDSGFDKEVAS